MSLSSLGEQRTRLRPLIEALFSGCRPAAVLAIVVAVGVNAIDGMARRWPAPHVRQESFVGRAPTGADSNSARAIVSLGDVLVVIAPRLHSAPDVVFIGDARAATIAVSPSRYAGSSAFAAEAATTLRSPGIQRSRCDELQIAAITSARPEAGAFVTDGDEPTESLIWTHCFGHARNSNSGGVIVTL